MRNVRIWVVVVALALLVAPHIGMAATAGTRENPVPWGDDHRVGDWDFRVVDADTTAYAWLLENDRNPDLPRSQYQYVLVRFEATYRGQGVGDATDIWFNAVGASNVAYDFESDCAASIESTYSIPDVFPGGTVPIEYCWEVKSSDVDSLVVYLRPFGEETRIFFSIDRPDGATPTP